jgi:hypothetical protein
MGRKEYLIAVPEHLRKAQIFLKGGSTMGDKIDDQQTRWVARLIPTLNSSIDALLHMPLGLDVWERHADALVVAASEAQLSELERRRLAQVERLSTVAAFAARASVRSSSSEKRS